jgi:hypothetical protein
LIRCATELSKAYKIGLPKRTPRLSGIAGLMGDFDHRHVCQKLSKPFVPVSVAIAEVMGIVNLYETYMKN